MLLAEPTTPFEQAAHQVVAAAEATLQPSAAVLLVPRRAVLRSGPIVAVAGAPDDPSVDVPVTLASAAGKDLAIAEYHRWPDERISDLAVRTGLRVRRIAQSRAWAGTGSVFGIAFRQSKARLIVMTKDTFLEFVQALASTPRHMADSKSG